MALKEKQVVVQFAGNDYDISNLEAIVKKDWKEAGRKVNELETLSVYVKPEEGKAYYVVNKEFEGKIDL